MMRALSSGTRLRAMNQTTGCCRHRAHRRVPITVSASSSSSSSSSSTVVVDSPSRHRKLQQSWELVTLVAGLNRGALATPTQRADVAARLAALQDTQAAALQGMDSADVEGLLAGKWQLIYTSVEVFRSSPFFWAFQAAIPGGPDIASAIFRFTDAIPGATVGQAFQTFDTIRGRLVSEVDLEVFPGAAGRVVTTSAFELSGPPTRLAVTILDTRVAGSNLLPQLFDSVAVPVKDLMEAVRGAGVTRVEADITYLDDVLRVMRTTADGAVFVYRRVGAQALP